MTPISSREPGHPPSRQARLLAIVAVSPQARVQCGNPGCGHGVYAAIHVVEDHGELMVLGSTCFAKRYGGSQALGLPAYSAGGGNGRLLTDAERLVLVNNTAELLASFKAEHERVMAEAVARLHESTQRRAQRTRLTITPTQPRAPAPRHPWPWQHSMSTSVAVLRSPEGQAWIRVQHRNGSQRLVPWPTFHGWETALPAPCGTPDPETEALVVPNIVVALKALQDEGYTPPQITRWPELLKFVPPLPLPSTV